MAWEAISHGWAATDCNLCSRDRDPRTGMVASTNWRSSAISCLIRQTQKWFLWLEIYAAPNCYCMLGSLFPFLFVKESYFWTNLLGIKLIYWWMKANFWTNFSLIWSICRLAINELELWPLCFLGFISSLLQLAWEKRLCCCCCRRLWDLDAILLVNLSRK